MVITRLVINELMVINGKVLCISMVFAMVITFPTVVGLTSYVPR